MVKNKLDFLLVKNHFTSLPKVHSNSLETMQVLVGKCTYPKQQTGAPVVEKSSLAVYRTTGQLACTYT